MPECTAVLVCTLGCDGRVSNLFVIFKGHFKAFKRHEIAILKLGVTVKMRVRGGDMQEGCVRRAKLSCQKALHPGNETGMS